MSDMGDNSKAERDIWMKHQAIAILDEERRNNLNAEVGTHRKQAKAAGIELGDLDWTVKVIRWPVGDIVDFFKRRLKALSFNNINVAAKVDEIFGSQTEDHRYAGILAGMTGKICSPPANFTPNERETWIEGWHEGNKARDAAQFDLAEEQSKAAAARETAASAGQNQKVDASQVAAAELGGEGYGDDGGGDGAAGDGPAAAAPETAAKVEGETQAQTGASPHQPAKPKRKPAADKSKH